MRSWGELGLSPAAAGWGALPATGFGSEERDWGGRWPRGGQGKGDWKHLVSERPPHCRLPPAQPAALPFLLFPPRRVCLPPPPPPAPSPSRPLPLLPPCPQARASPPLWNSPPCAPSTGGALLGCSSNFPLNSRPSPTTPASGSLRALLHFSILGPADHSAQSPSPLPDHPHKTRRKRRAPRRPGHLLAPHPPGASRTGAAAQVAARVRLWQMGVCGGGAGEGRGAGSRTAPPGVPGESGPQRPAPRGLGSLGHRCRHCPH